MYKIDFNKINQLLEEGNNSSELSRKLETDALEFVSSFKIIGCNSFCFVDENTMLASSTKCCIQRFTRKDPSNYEWVKQQEIDVNGPEQLRIIG